MKSYWGKAVCRLLVALMVWAPLQSATAGMIATDGVAGAQQERAQVAKALEGLGVEATAAQARAASLTDEEARTLAAQVQSAPAGGVYGEGIVFILLVLAIAYAWYKHYIDV
ncbi:MAG TPA: PA2779 family protein [Burkholderiales bacterium]